MSSWDLQTHGTGSQSFTETQIETSGYYNRGPFNGMEYIWLILLNVPTRATCGTANKTENRKQKTRVLNPQSFSMAVFCNQCDANASFDGATLSIRLCRPCLVKIGANVI
ncbi:unnamed protein product [Caenorhabditis nigoni]